MIDVPNVKVCDGSSQCEWQSRADGGVCVLVVVCLETALVVVEYVVVGITRMCTNKMGTTGDGDCDCEYGTRTYTCVYDTRYNRFLCANHDTVAVRLGNECCGLVKG